MSINQATQIAKQIMVKTKLHLPNEILSLEVSPLN